MKALSIRAPWWWFILHAGKDIENRDWPTRFRGVVLVHASNWWKPLDVLDEAFDVGRMMAGRDGFNSPSADDLRTDMRALGGHIVGTVEIADCVTSSDSPWFVGKHGFVLRNPRVASNPILLKGSLGLFDVPNNIAGALRFEKAAA